MAWIAITEALLASRLSGPEMSAMKTAALGAGQVPAVVLAQTISATVREVRGFVSGCKTNVLGEGETIPDELEAATLSVLRWRYANRLPGVAKLFAGVDREAEYEQATQVLRMVSRCEFGIVSPVVEAPAQVAASSPRITPRPTQFSARDQAGI